MYGGYAATPAPISRSFSMASSFIAAAIITTPAMTVAMAALLAIFGCRAGEESASIHATAGSAGRM